MSTKTQNASVILTENTDDFIIGDRVWVGGTKPGHIQYIGETQFAPGDWAGVVLDDPIGKNDGSVAGVRYFMCEPKRGVFSRLTKLTKEPIQHLIDEEREAIESLAPANGSIRSESPRLSVPNRGSTHTSPASSVIGVKKLGDLTSPSALNRSIENETGLKMNDRVIVSSTSGSKTGTLRYLGSTEFAAGEWAGVELDDPLGKNDGSVAGKRYFECKMKYGLFAPIHKVSKSPSSGVIKRGGTPSSRLGSSNLHRRSGSHESLTSSISSASSIARASRKVGRSPASVSATHVALQEALKEKEQHIEQLLKERDMERAEVARAAVQVEESERKLAIQKADHQRFLEEAERNMAKLREIAENAEHQRKELSSQLEESNRKLEDLQFRMEEETISKGDLERSAQASRSQLEADVERIQQLKQSLEEERKRSERLEHDSQKLFQTEELLAKHVFEIEELKCKLNMTQNKIQGLETSKDEICIQASQKSNELTRKENHIRDLEVSLESSNKEKAELKKNLRVLEESVDDFRQKLAKQEEICENLTNKLAISESSSSNLSQELQSLKLDFSDLQRKLQATEERCETISKQKSKLEEDIKNLMKSTGDSSEQLSKMNEELREKERFIEKQSLQLQSYSQELAKHQDLLVQEKERVIEEVKNLSLKHNEEICNLKQKVETMLFDLKKAQGKMTQMATLHEEELEALHKSKDLEISSLRKDLESKDNQILQFNNQLRESQLVSKEANEQAELNKENTEKQFRELRAERDRLLREREEFLRMQTILEEKVCSLETQKENLIQKQQEHDAVVCERDSKLAALTSEVDRLRSEFSNHRLELQRKLAETQLEVQAMQDMHAQLEAQNSLIEELQARHNENVAVNEKLHSEAEQVIALKRQKEELEKLSSDLKKQLEDIKQREGISQVNFNNEKVVLQNMLENTKAALQQREKELDKQQQELIILQNETSNLKAFKSTVQNLEQEKQQSENKIIELQVALEHSKANANFIDPSLEKLKDEKDSAESQIDFLNSVIVDMQKKNDELQARIQILETGMYMVDSDNVNLNGIKRSVIPPRLFCDICDVFDLHDTEDCPRQAMAESPPPTQHHGSRNHQRPYCDICEVFGHWTENCDDNETF